MGVHEGPPQKEYELGVIYSVLSDFCGALGYCLAVTSDISRSYPADFRLAQDLRIIEFRELQTISESLLATW